MLESVDKSVSNTDAERRAGSTPALGTDNDSKTSISVKTYGGFLLFLVSGKRLED